MFSFDLFSPDTLVPLAAMAIPIVAIVGGITAGIVKTIGQQRLIELAQRERIAAIERGIDPSKLPPLPVAGGDLMGTYLTPQQHGRRLSQGLLIGGLVTLAAGISLGVFLRMIADEPGVWAVGLIPASVGAALLLSAWAVRPRNGDRGAGTPPREG